MVLEQRQRNDQRQQPYGSRILNSISPRLSGRMSAQTLWMYFRHSSLRP